ncbi:MAG: helix-turn-helix domain-containing protein, partial [Elusimicrobiales bacterium]
LKGALMKIYNFSVFTNEFPTIDKVKVWVKEYIPESEINNDNKITIEDIQEVVAQEYGISIDELMSKQRREKLVFPRHIAIYLAHELTDMSWTDIGKAFDKDHSTAIHASDKIKSMISNDPFFAEAINKIINKIKTRKEVK